MEKPARDVPSHKSTNLLKAIGLLMVAICLFTCLDGTAKYLSSVVQLPVMQLVWIRFVGQFLAMVIALGLVSIPRLLRTQRPKQQLIRSALLLGSTLFNFLALRHLRLDQAATIMFLAPLTVAVLAGPALGEWIGWRRLVAVLVGFAGILVVIRPGYGAFHPAMVFAFCGMASYVGFILVTRYLAAYDPPENTLFYSMIIGTGLVAPFAIVDWVWPSDAFIWLLLASLGFFAACGHYIFILAHRWAPASAIAPFLYMQLLTATVFGFLAFGDLPDLWTLAGSAIIIASGIYLLHRERVTGRAAVLTNQEPPGS